MVRNKIQWTRTKFVVFVFGKKFSGSGPLLFYFLENGNLHKTWSVQVQVMDPSSGEREGIGPVQLLQGEVLISWNLESCYD